MGSEVVHAPTLTDPTSSHFFLCRWYKLKDGKAAAITHAIGEDAVVDGATTIDKLKQYAPSVKSLRQFYHGYEWRGGTESHMFNALEAKANEKVPRTPVLGCPLSEVLRRDKAKDEFLTSRINWVVQSSAVDYLHLMLVSMRYFCNRYKIDAKYVLCPIWTCLTRYFLSTVGLAFARAISWYSMLWSTWFRPARGCA